MKQDQRREMIEEYGRGYDLLMAALAQVPREAWEFRPAPGEWSIHETVIHMADSESIGVTRARMLIAEPGETLMPYDDNKWATALDYQNQSADDALQLFRLLRQTTYQVLKTLPDRVYMHEVIMPEMVHPEYGERYTLEKWLNIYTGHIRDHIEQMRKNHEAWKTQNK
jgi:uncharacterized damage-inducible protein DinB